MTLTEIRELQPQEMAEVLYELETYALQASPPRRDREEFQSIVKELQGCTYFALYENELPVACVASTAMTQNVRGGMYGMGGVWGVATNPSARRKGYSRRLLAQLMLHNKENGRPLSCLYPFREVFYERLGYINFPRAHKVHLNIRALLPIAKKDFEGEVELVHLEKGYDEYLNLLKQMRERTHGMALFDIPDINRAQSSNLWLALAKDAGQVVGGMIYRIKGERPTEFKLSALRFYYTTSQGKYLLLGWIARHIDQTAEVELHLPPFELPETWMADLVAGLEPAWRGGMGRILDVAALAGMQASPGSFSARLNDPVCPWNEKIWRFETHNGLLQVDAAQRTDCELSIQALSALVYGTHDPADFAFLGWGNPAPELQHTMGRMFPRRLPYLHENY
ncbi:MAG TPA: GNAT family N-acetyltransferase [Anaerolineales bacterium]|nr:GNAT family N-acetyltransferase [Anaerolineales bacterium]